MRRLIVLFTLMLIAACRPPIAPPTPTATLEPTVPLPPTWTPTPIRGATTGPVSAPKPAHTIGPVATPAASIEFTSTDSLFTLKVPSNWTMQSAQRKLISDQAQAMTYIVLSAPGTAPQPAILIFYGWPAAGPIDNDNAWQQAYAIAALGIKVCPITLTTGGAITLGGATGKYIGYVDGCDVQGELIGFVRATINYGILIEAPVAIWETWRPILRAIVGSLAFTK